MNFKKFLFSLFFILIFTGCQKISVPVSRSIFAMGTFVEITVFDENRPKAEAAINKALQKIQELSDKFSVFNPSSEISEVNQRAARKSVKVSAEVFEILKTAQKFSRMTDGAFDITVGPLMELWGFHQKQGRVPQEAEIKETLKKVGWENLILDEKNQAVKFARTGIKLDLGGIAKGDAADLAASILKKEKVSSALVNAGGNIFALGSPPEKKFWVVGVQHPRQKIFFAKVFLKDNACATSGDYENYFIKNRKRYGHIMNPQTGHPVEGILSVTIVAPKAIDTDVLSTAVFVLGLEKGKSLIESLPETFALIIYEDEKIPLKINYYLTKDSEKYFKI